MPSTQQRKMANIDVVETSGVDHPAHLQEGWVVCKSATEQDITSLFGSATEGSTMANTEASEPATKAAEPTVADLQKKVDALTKELADEKSKKANPFGKAAEQDEEAEMLKSLPASVRDMLEKSARETEELRKAAAQDRENFEKERDARADEKAVAEFQTLYKSVALDAATVAPALRRVEATSPELAKAINTALAAADAQLATAGLFTEVGKSTEKAGGSAIDRINAAAAELRKSESGKGLTEAAAFAKAVQDSPELYSEYIAEMGK